MAIWQMRCAVTQTASCGGTRGEAHAADKALLVPPHYNMMPAGVIRLRCCDAHRHSGRSGKRKPGLGKSIALDIARGLAFLHTHRIVHLASH